MIGNTVDSLRERNSGCFALCTIVCVCLEMHPKGVGGGMSVC